MQSIALMISCCDFSTAGVRTQSIRQTAAAVGGCGILVPEDLPEPVACGKFKFSPVLDKIN